MQRILKGSKKRSRGEITLEL